MEEADSKRFKFVVKGSKLITHIKQLKGAEDAVSELVSRGKRVFHAFDSSRSKESKLIAVRESFSFSCRFPNRSRIQSERFSSFIGDFGFEALLRKNLVAQLHQ
jgi:uncharacterized protein YecE (DUF72 family)